MSSVVSVRECHYGTLQGGDAVHRVDLLVLPSPTQSAQPAPLFQVSLLTYGATILSVQTPDRQGRVQEVTLQHDTLALISDEDERSTKAYNGAICGRVANRMAHAKCKLNDREYSFHANNGPNSLHGGRLGFDKKVWGYSILPEGDGVSFTYRSADGEEGYPGTLDVEVQYRVHARAEEGGGGAAATAAGGGGGEGGGPTVFYLSTDYRAKNVDAEGKDTVVNLTNHAYWNLSGDCQRRIHNHILDLGCSRYLPVDDTSIPTGEMLPVEGTAFDYRVRPSSCCSSSSGGSEASAGGKALARAIEQIDGGGKPGLDHCFVVDATEEDGASGHDSGRGAALHQDPWPMSGDDEGNPANKNQKQLPFVARLEDPTSGRVMEMRGSHPGVQVYTANWMPEEPVGDQSSSSSSSNLYTHVQWGGVALEPQQFPNAANTEGWRDSVLLPAGGAGYSERCVYRFTQSTSQTPTG